MNWSNLKKNKCPKCEVDLSDKFDGKFFHCTCGFMISNRRFREIVSNQISKDIDRDDEEMEAERDRWRQE